MTCEQADYEREQATYELGPCRYFALCENDAVTTVPNRFVGPVPTCQRCLDKVARIEEGC